MAEVQGTQGMPDTEKTTIAVSGELADELYQRKGRGESYEDVIWRLIEETDADEEDTQSATQPPADPADRREPQTPAETEPDAAHTDSDDLETALATIDVPGSGAKAAARRDAVRAAVDYLREHGEGTPAEFRENVWPDHKAEYTRGDSPAHSWWKNCVYPALRELAETDERVEKADTTGRWSWQSADGGDRGE